MVRLVEKVELGPVLRAMRRRSQPGRQRGGGHANGGSSTPNSCTCSASAGTWSSHRLRHGLLHRAFRGIFLWGHPVPPPGALEVAAVMACRRRAIARARVRGSAVGVHCRLPDEVDGARLLGRHRSRPGLLVHRTHDPPSATRSPSRYGLPVTSPLRTLLDLAAAGYPRLEQAVSHAHAAGLSTRRGLTRYLRRPQRGSRARRRCGSSPGWRPRLHPLTERASPAQPVPPGPAAPAPHQREPPRLGGRLLLARGGSGRRGRRVQHPRPSRRSSSAIAASRRTSSPPDIRSCGCPTGRCTGIRSP